MAGASEIVFGLRLATAEDISSLQRLIAASVRGLQTEDYTPAQREGALSHTFGVDTQLIADGTYFVAFPLTDPSVFAGCGGWSFRKTLFGSDNSSGRSPALLDPAVDAAKIRAVFVHPDWARQGIASLILDRSEQAAHAVGFRRFEMGSTLTGVRLYGKRGYELEQQIDLSLPNGQTLPIVRMTKQA